MNNPSEIVTRLFINTDSRNWSEVENCFAEEVLLDYSTMTGSPAEKLSPSDIVSGWKQILPGFHHTRYRILLWHGWSLFA